jgi:hypothetical protein
MAGLVPAIPMRRAQRFAKTRLARALLIEITGTSPVMTSVGASISSEHALADFDTVEMTGSTLDTRQLVATRAEHYNFEHVRIHRSASRRQRRRHREAADG